MKHPHTHIALIILLLAALHLTACHHQPTPPTTTTPTHTPPPIYPDYTDVTIPPNIAPLNFMLPTPQYQQAIARITTPDGTTHTYSNGTKIQIPIHQWHDILQTAKGQSIKIEVWGKTNNQWHTYNPFHIHIAPEPIDPYISYRLIEPTYVAWNNMQIAQRNLTNYTETQIFNNTITANNPKIGQCINCHSYQNYNPNNMLFHVRLSNSGTIIVNDGKISRVDLRRPYTISSGVYPAWHPTKKLIAFSTNLTRQAFHTNNPNKIEVYDLASDIILYNITTDSVTIVSADTTQLEVYPTFSPDGQYLYYCKSAPLPDTLKHQDIRTTYQKIQYNIYRRHYNPTTNTFSPEQLIYDAAAYNQSATLPRISPDGQYILFAQGQYGCFHIRHTDADITLMPLNTLPLQPHHALPLHTLNSPNHADSYPTWSSNGHWIMISSRRDDDTYSRIYIAHHHNGHTTKPFLLPQQDPLHNTYQLKCYNRPEFMTQPVKITPKQFSQYFDK